MEKNNPLLISSDPGARDLADKLRKQSNRPVAKIFGIDGEQLLLGVDGALVPMALDVVPLGELPTGFGDAHKDVMGIVYTAVQQIHERGRKVPLTRGELLGQFKADKRAVKRLEKWGFITSRVVPLESTKTKRKKGDYALYYFTAKGRAYAREHFDPAYGLPPPRDEPGCAEGDPARPGEGKDGGGPPEHPG